MKIKNLITLALILSSMSAMAQPRFDERNPGVHDPVMAKEGDTYYIFATGGGISVMSSKDNMQTWQPQAPVFSESPAWVQNVIPGFRNGMWAPDIIYYNGLWHIFYACSISYTNQSCIGHATNATLDPNNPAFHWEDRGMIIQSVPVRDQWNCIDPNIIIDENGKPWMDFGSFWNGIMMVQLTDDMNALAEPQNWRNVCRRERAFLGFTPEHRGMGAVEAPFIYKHGDWFYLFVSFDDCCNGVNSDYHVVVGRSKSAAGPYLDKDGVDMYYGGGSVALEGDNVNWAAVGHNAAYTFDGKDYFVTHAYRNDNGQSKLVISEIKWENDWPILSY